MQSPARPRIVVVPYDLLWTGAFDRASAEISTALGDALTKVDHIDSTSVPGLPAKPVIDMLAVVHDLETVDMRSPAVEALGYIAMGAFGIDGRRYFRRDAAAGIRTHQIHTFVEGSPHIARHIAFRDYLRTHPDVMHQYGPLKQRLAAAHPNDMDAYMDGKDPFIQSAEADAIAWHARR